MSLLTELRDLLPTPTARWSAILTSTLLLPAFLAPRFLQPLLAPTATEAEVVLAQLLVPALLALFFAYISLVSVIRSYREQSKQHALELQTHLAHFESLASEEKKRHDNFTKPLHYDHRGIV